MKNKNQQLVSITAFLANCKMMQTESSGRGGPRTGGQI